jgi:2'-5' RNA ligase
MLRLFFALQPALEQSVALVEQVSPLIARLQAQRTPAENLHATICFVGAVAEDRLETLTSVAASVRGRPAELRFDTLEHWRTPRVLCATSADATPAALLELSERLGQASTSAGLHPDLKPLRAHLTLARKIDAGRAAQEELPQPLPSPVLLRCDRFALMRSDRGESGTIYSVVASWPLDIA